MVDASTKKILFIMSIRLCYTMACWASSQELTIATIPPFNEVLRLRVRWVNRIGKWGGEGASEGGWGGDMEGERDVTS